MTVSRKKRQIFLVCIDIALLIIAIYLSLWIRELELPSSWWFYWHLKYFIPIIITWIICFYIIGFYSLEMPYTGFRTLSYLSIITVICTLIGFAVFYLNLRTRQVPKPKTILVIYGIVVFTLISFWRWLFSKVAIKFISKVNIAFIGINETVNELLKNMRNFSYMSYQVMFLYDENYQGGGGTYCNISVIKKPDIFIDEINRNKVHTVVFSDGINLPGSVQHILFELMREHIYFVNITDFYETFMRRIPLKAVNELWLLQNVDLRSKAVYRLFKQVIDIVMAAVFFAVTLPFWPFIMALIKMESAGPVFFKQERTGYLGRPFTIIKFRTMRVAGNTQEPTGHNDSRITRIGKFLRKTRIDEIPQFLNIIKFEMSFIGPRPERPELIQNLEREVPFYRQRLLVKPGLSGWDQVSGEYHSPSREDTYKKLQYDLYYIKNFSFFLDVSIFFKTLVTIFKRAGV
jgi:exopolysaccharide biosynthesis polyprenyl glycosylphosphotransferase